MDFLLKNYQESCNFFMWFTRYEIMWCSEAVIWVQDGYVSCEVSGLSTRCGWH